MANVHRARAEHRSASQLAEMKRQRGNQKITAFFTPPTKRAVPDRATSASADRGTTHDGATSTSGDLATDTRDGSTGASADLSTTEPITVSLPRPRGRRTDDASKHRIGYDREWEHNHPWVFYVEGEGMYCKYCRKFDTRNRQNQSKVWNLEACTTLRRDVLARHEASTMHKEAIEQERACQIVKARGGHQGSNARASDAAKKSCCWCYEVSLLAV